MTRLIDKDMLIEILGVMQGLCDTKAALIQNSKIWQQVKDLPTVDAVPVVRCCDCKYYLEDSYGEDEWVMCRRTNLYTDEDKYCAWAERKEE